MSIYRKLVILYGQKPGNIMRTVWVGSKQGEILIMLKDGKDFTQRFLDQTYIKEALGLSAKLEMELIEIALATSVAS